MSFDTPLVEYLIIGSHTAVWIVLLVLFFLGVPLSALSNIDAGVVLLSLPMVYLLGMLVDGIVHYPLEPFRKSIRDSIFEYERYKDEFIAYASPELYAAYEVRVRRVRIMGASIFNWPLLGTALLLNLGFSRPVLSFSVVTSSLLLCILSVIVWRGLYQRAYRFRRNACDVIREGRNGTEVKIVAKAEST